MRDFWQTTFSLLNRILAGVTIAALLVIVAALTIYSVPWAQNAAGASSLNNPSQHGAAHVLATATDAPSATPTDVPPTDTPVPPPPTPTPVLVTFTCASGEFTEPGSLYLTLCITSQPGSQVNLDIRYCGSLSTESPAPLGADGTWSSNAVRLSTTCAPPLGVTITAWGTSGDGRPLTGGTSLTVSK